MNDRIYPAQTTALVLIDVLNDFLADDGKLHASIAPMLDKTGFVAHVAQLLEGARAAGVKIIFAPHGTDEHSFDDIKHVHPRMQWALANEVLRKGTYGADFYAPLRPREGEIVVSHHRMFDSFIGTDLEAQLRANGIEKVVLAGLTSQTCIEGTGRHALEAGFHVTFITDAVADFTEAAHEAALSISYPTFGHDAMTVAEFLDAVDSVAA
ncbi:cysteine hydrolase family protein [Paraburkholderia hospita]|jgi:nicotinamidase-related amidase|uniref:Amidase n=1 Tax=Paraburkholderia hospita TaxID=169430 RepID=A0AAN1JID6_9BURK|nr:isochorismatase family cysteine hydrolase [Paraburkholderia hospita]SKD02002.1 Nicotinamidase-related amidase [Burkholderia sp. CF099]AUT74487.1 cysteine hydrolase [Paraburkholderia hospita]EIN01683.1 amidase [Paraburkholderia hospita]OUL78005.1 amidase [Paraburkholderia hospita]OUL79381.1 amidase [Paraburkholderia hospita]